MGAAYASNQSPMTGALVGGLAPLLSGEAAITGYATAANLSTGMLGDAVLSSNSAILGYFGGLLASGPSVAVNSPETLDFYIGPAAFDYGQGNPGCW
jgi:hypothetical protein